MSLNNIKLGFAITGSHCTIAPVIDVLKMLKQNNGIDILPIFSEAVYNTDTKFGASKTWIQEVEDITGKKIIHTVKEAEPIGPQKLLDCLVIAPCTGNTLAKITAGVTDGPVLMAAKAHLRNQRPVVIAISTNDGLGTNAKNIGILLNRKNIYFVPFGQDSPLQKPTSLVANFSLIADTVESSLISKQIQPVLLPIIKEEKH